MLTELTDLNNNVPSSTALRESQAVQNTINSEWTTSVTEVVNIWDSHAIYLEGLTKVRRPATNNSQSRKPRTRQ
jgi:hypothetical protein